MGLSVRVISLLCISSSLLGQTAGKWDATVEVNKVSIPFQFELGGTPAAPRGWFFNGDERIVSTAGNWTGPDLILRFAQYGSVLKARLESGELRGTYDRGTRGLYPFRAVPAVAPEANASVPDIAGTWDFAITDTKGEKAWRFVARQKGAQVSGAILRVDGDTGVLSGRYQNGSFRLSHFSGARPLVVIATPQADGSLELLLNGKNRFTALRIVEARAANVPEPADTFKYTSFANPGDRFRFSFPNLDGQMVSNADAKFKGKVVLVAISGSWCPNCHDEAPYLESLYRKYRAEGLEIVSLSFEEADELKSPERVRAFIKLYGLDYTVLLAGEPEQLREKLPQAVNLSSFPTTVFLGRDGKVRGVHSGFSSRATGRFYDEQAAEMEALIEKLLHENGGTSAVSSGRGE